LSFKINGNEIKSVDFTAIKNLILVDLSNNQLESFPKFTENLQLRGINLSFNQISEITEVQLKQILNIRNLTKLDLSHNKLSGDVADHFTYEEIINSRRSRTVSPANLGYLKELNINYNSLVAGDDEDEDFLIFLEEKDGIEDSDENPKSWKDTQIFPPTTPVA
jgi:Leucine-rich repeat (LRR) protein